MQLKNKNEAKLLKSVGNITWGDKVLWLVLLGILLAGIAAFVRQYIFGLGVTGLNRPVYWGVYITNFVFFIGLAHSGTFISAILRVAGQEWRKPLTRAAEAITLFSLPFGVAAIIVDMGRPERALSLFLYGRYEAPFLWDLSAVGLYFLSSIVFMTMVVVTVHTVVSWVFGMTLQPGWHTALIGPFFLLGAILSGTAAVVIALSILRKAFHLEDILNLKLFNSLRKLLITFVLGWLYMMIAEYLTTGYGNMTEEMVVMWDKFRGSYALMFWSMTLLVFVLPLLIFIFKGKKSIGWMVFASVLINIGMWMERYIVIVPTEVSPRILPVMGSGAYTPTWTEALITAAFFAGTILLYAVFARLFPIIPIWETAEVGEAEEVPAVGAEPAPQQA